MITKRQFLAAGLASAPLPFGIKEPIKKLISPKAAAEGVAIKMVKILPPVLSPNEVHNRLAATNPSAPVINDIHVDGSKIILNWIGGEPSWQVERCLDLKNPVWEPISYPLTSRSFFFNNTTYPKMFLRLFQQPLKLFINGDHLTWIPFRTPVNI